MAAVTSTSKNSVRRNRFTCSLRFAMLGLSLLIANTSRAGLIETFEAAGVTQSTVSNTEVINFNNLAKGSYTSQIFQFPNLTVTYSGSFSILGADKYGGAADPSAPSKGTNYLAVSGGKSVTMTLSTPQAYFGIWYSAADQLNDLSFYRGSTLLASVTGTGPVLSALPSSYNGNPTAAFHGQNSGEKYVFIDFSAQATSDMFDKIVLSNRSGGTIFESDNHTFAAAIQNPPPGMSAVPEPNTFALLALGGLGIATHSCLRRRQKCTNVI